MKNTKTMLLIIFLLTFMSGCASKKMEGENTMKNDDKEKPQINKVVGSWVSTESDWPMEVDITGIDSKKLNLEFLNTEDNKGNEIVTLYNTDGDTLMFYTEDKKIEYRFCVDEDDKLLMIKFYNNDEADDSPNTVRPWDLIKKK